MIRTKQRQTTLCTFSLIPKPAILKTPPQKKKKKNP